MARNRIARATALCLLFACTEGPGSEDGPKPARIPEGGTLRVGIPVAPGGEFTNPLGQSIALDPGKIFAADQWGLLRCCLVRTLLSYSGKPTRAGGATLQPDLAASMPEVSADGLTWTFRLKRGLRYGPPLQDVPIRAQDIIRAMERHATSDFRYFYTMIQGFEAFADGDADSIAGLEAPDDLTLRVHLLAPTGDVGERFTLPSSAPIPPHPTDPGARFGVATGHDEEGYGGFLVSSGPYMLEGAQELDFTLPPGDQRAATGFDPGTSITMVRNPSWDRRLDAFRGAYVDRIELSFQDSMEESAAAQDAGQIDLVMLGNMRPPQAPPSQIEDYRSDPSKGYVSIEPADTIQFVSMNLAVPPLDDVHVRKAINFAVDKSGLQEIMGGPDSGQIIGHIALNSLENDLLLNYDPYGAPGHTGDVVAARTEMAQSRYDRDGDGVCDASPCKGLRALVHDLPFGRGVGEQIASDLRGIGIDLDVEPLDLNTLFEEITDPTQHVPLVLTLAWQKDILNASTWFEGLFSAGNGFSLLGASPDQLKEWGYSVTEVPNIDARIESCRTKVGETQLRCWVDIDQHLMENVVPWVPYAVFTMVNVVPKRIASFSYDQFANVPALDQIALVQGS